jgi:flagellar hook protein FlgE
MLRSMYAGVSGLRTHQTMMDVVGNNIANVNTAGYKTSRSTFQEALTQVVRGAAVGTNPVQYGLGAGLAGVDTVFSQGASQVTGRSTDLAIQGDGFFIVEVNGQQQYTRAGAFAFDSNGTLTTAQGHVLHGYVATPPTPPATTGATTPLTLDLAAYTDIVIGQDGGITGRRNDTGAVEAIGRVAVATFPNPGGLTRVGESLYSDSANSGAADVGAPTENGRGALQSGVLEMSNVDLAQEFTNLVVAQRGFQANARTITTSDEMLQELVNLKR